MTRWISWPRIVQTVRKSQLHWHSQKRLLSKKPSFAWSLLLSLWPTLFDWRAETAWIKFYRTPLNIGEHSLLGVACETPEDPSDPLRPHTTSSDLSWDMNKALPWPYGPCVHKTIKGRFSAPSFDSRYRQQSVRLGWVKSYSRQAFRAPSIIYSV